MTNFEKENIETTETGIDLSLLRRMLLMSPDERISAHDEAIELFNELKNSFFKAPK